MRLLALFSVGPCFFSRVAHTLFPPLPAGVLTPPSFLFVFSRVCLRCSSSPNYLVVVRPSVRRSFPRQQQPGAALLFLGAEFGGKLAAVVSEAIRQQVLRKSTGGLLVVVVVM